METAGNPETVRVGVLGGTRLPGNVETFLRNVDRLLERYPTDFQFDLIVRRDVIDSIPGYDVVDPGIEKSDRALETIRTLTTSLTQYTRRYPVDVLFQVTKFPVHGFVATVAGHRTDTPVVTRLAGDNFREHQFSERTLDCARTFALNNLIGVVPAWFSDATIVLGPHGKSEIERRAGDGDVRIIPQPVDFNRFFPVNTETQAEIRERLGVSSDRRTLLTVGRITERKGMDDLMTTARTLASRGANVEWLVLGDGPLYDAVQSTPLVNAIGRVPHRQMPDYYRAADLLVHPSRIEGLPNVLLEAAACGTPTVARAVGETGTVASETYTKPTRLPNLVLADYETPDLRDRFAPETLRKEYAEILMKTGTR